MCLVHQEHLDDWVLCRIYKKNSSAEKAISGDPSTEQSHGSPTSSSAHFDGVLDSLPAIDDKFLNFPTNDTSNTFDEEDQRADIQKFDTGNYNWAGIGAFGLSDTTNHHNPPNSTSVDPAFNMQNGIRSERNENPGYLFSMNTTDPFGIRYPTQPSSSGYRQFVRRLWKNIDMVWVRCTITMNIKVKVMEALVVDFYYKLEVNRARCDALKGFGPCVAMGALWELDGGEDVVTIMFPGRHRRPEQKKPRRRLS
ncbi:hypothetical protein M8C21_024998 [Ambrosia artemisiifolia]|uniref:Uncharacterized protein n=1 Tax=Ambrosia artemisiifolia TaxID=4212 RepID=A0AAD5C0V9_AMBAR|nr:hypothetical protein M8C21_024998 [Ambrosia artemisiifolia]